MLSQTPEGASVAFGASSASRNVFSLKMGELSEGCTEYFGYATFPMKPGLNREGNVVSRRQPQPVNRELNMNRPILVFAMLSVAAAATLAAQDQQQQPSPFSGTSNPPPDSTIQESEPPAPAPPPKPSPAKYPQQAAPAPTGTGCSRRQLIRSCKRRAGN